MRMLTVTNLTSAYDTVIGLMLNPIIPQVGGRPIAIVGGLIGAIGYAGCFFAESILHLCIGFGVLGGKNHKRRLGAEFGGTENLLMSFLGKFFISTPKISDDLFLV